MANQPGRTRDWHFELDEAEAEVDEPFKNSFGEIMYPGDPHAKPQNVYNCRCTLVSIVKGFKKIGDNITENVDNTSESGSVFNFMDLGKIDTHLLEKEFGKINTDEIIVTNERMEHIKDHHPQDFNLFELYGSEAVTEPDVIIKDLKNDGTVFMVKSLPETNLNVVVRLALETDDPKRKNSVVTFYRIRNKNLEKLKKKHKVLYNKE